MAKKGARSPKLEKAITAVSLLSIVLGMAIGYPALTGNVIALDTKTALSSGGILFVIGLIGVFLANKR